MGVNVDASVKATASPAELQRVSILDGRAGKPDSWHVRRRVRTAGKREDHDRAAARGRARPAAARAGLDQGIAVGRARAGRPRVVAPARRRRRPRCSGGWRPKLASGVLDNFFHRAFSHRLEALPGPIVEVHCSCPGELALDRYQSRHAPPLPLRPHLRRRHVRHSGAAPTRVRSRSAARSSSSTRRVRSTSTRLPRGCALTSEARASRPTTARRCSRRGHVP